MHNELELQQSFNSCALAALSYALNVKYGIKSNERTLARKAAAFYTGSGGLPPEHGYSVGDVVRLSAALGVEAGAWRLSFNTIPHHSLPALLWLRENGRDHVVVLLALASESAHLFDPAVGHYWVSEDTLAERWLADSDTGLFIALTSVSSHG